MTRDTESGIAEYPDPGQRYAVVSTFDCYGCYYKRPDGDPLHAVNCPYAWPCVACGKLIPASDLRRHERITPFDHHISFCSAECKDKTPREYEPPKRW